MTIPVFKPIVEPTLIETLQALKSDVFKNLYCHVPGRIQSFDGAKKTAVIEVLFATQLPDGTIVNYPALVDCPVFTLQGGGGFIQFPIAEGDPCLVVFADRNIDAWFKNSQQAAVPFDQVGGKPGRMHDLSDGMAFVGFSSLTDTLPDYQAAKAIISYAGASIELASGEITFKSASGNSSIDLSAGAAGINNGSGGEVTINASSLITIANNVTSLLTLLNGLIDVIAAATVQTSGTPPLTAVTIAALQAYKLQLATLLL